MFRMLHWITLWIVDLIDVADELTLIGLPFGRFSSGRFLILNIYVLLQFSIF